MRNFFQTATLATRPRGVLALALSALLAVTVACEEDDGPTGPGVDDIAAVEFSTDQMNVELGATAQLDITLRDGDGDVIDPEVLGDNVLIDFTSSDLSVVNVTETGLVMPVSLGTATITVTAAGETDTITINVVLEGGATVGTVEIARETLELITGESANLDVTVRDQDGNEIQVPVTFTTSDEAVAVVTDDGLVTANSAGDVTITAEVGGETDTVLLTVLASTEGAFGITVDRSVIRISVGDQVVVPHLVIATDETGTVIDDPMFTFTSSDPSVASVGPDAVLTAHAIGTTLVTVTSPLVEGSATVRVNVGDIEGLDVLAIVPDTATIAVGGTVFLEAEVTVEGELDEDFLVVFASSDDTVAEVNTVTGEVTGIAPGTATITATTGNLTAEAVVTVE